MYTLGSYPELVSHQTSPSDHGDITPALGCCGSCSCWNLHCPVQDKSPLADTAVAGTGREGQGIPCPWHPACPGSMPPKFSSCIYCFPKWKELNPGPSLLLPDKETQLRGSPAQFPMCPEQFSHLTPTRPCSIPLLQPLLWPSIPTATPASLH